MDPLELLPPELWEMIFEKVEDPQDWLNLYRTSVAFEGVVGDRRPQSLLSKVLPQVCKHLNGGMSGLLRLRLISRKWKKVVDRILDSKNGDTVFQKGDIWEKYHFADSAKIYSFMDKFGTHPGNPFIGSFVVISFEPEDKTEEMMAEFESTVLRLMNKFGMHIKKINLNWAEANLDKALRQLRSCVELTPNLEALGVKFNEPEPYAIVDYREANPALGNQRMPILSKLNSFSFYTHIISRKSTDLQNIIIRMCCNPDTITIVDVAGVPPALASFPKLEEAVFKLRPGGGEHERSMANYSCPLSRLTLKKRGSIRLRSLVKYAEQFKDTLTSLELDCDLRTIVNHEEEDSQLRLDLSLLEYLTLRCRYHIPPFSLLANLSNLEKLCICQPKYASYYYPNLQSFEGFAEVVETEMSQFHIWETLPKLKKIKLTGTQTKIYVRDNINKA